METCFNASEATNFSASGALPVPDVGYLQGLVVNSSTSGTLTLTDGKGRTIVNALVLTAGQSPILFGARYIGGLTATITGAANVTLMYVG
jgi:hypothetical protein